MPIPVICSCSAKMKVGDHLAGKHIKCPKCGSVIAVGGPNGAAPMPALAPPVPVAVAPPAPSAGEVLGQSGLSDDERERLADELETGEGLLWAGKPASGWAFFYGWAIGAGLIFMAIILLVVLAITGRDGLFKDGFSTLFTVILGGGGLGCLAAGIIWPYYRRWLTNKVVYAVTTKRALAWLPDYFGKIRLFTYDGSDMPKLYRSDVTQGPDGVGSLVFGTVVKKRQTREGTVRSYYSYGFFLIRGAARVEKLLRDTLVEPYLEKMYDE